MNGLRCHPRFMRTKGSEATEISLLRFLQRASGSHSLCVSPALLWLPVTVFAETTFNLLCVSLFKVLGMLRA